MFMSNTYDPNKSSLFSLGTKSQRLFSDSASGHSLSTGSFTTEKSVSEKDEKLGSVFKFENGVSNSTVISLEKSKLFGPRKPNPFDKLDEYILESIFILSDNPALSKISSGLFRISQCTRTQVKFIKRNIYPREDFVQSVFYSKYPRIARKEKLAIALIKNGIDINQGRGNSIYNRIFRYKMNDALFVMLRLYKKVKVAYAFNTLTPNLNPPDILKENNYYSIFPLITQINIMDTIKKFELYKDQNIKTLLTLIDIKTIKLDLVCDCGIPVEDLFVKENRKIFLYRSLINNLSLDELMKMAIIKDQPKLTRYIIEYVEYSRAQLEDFLSKTSPNQLGMSSSQLDTSSNKACTVVRLFITELKGKEITEITKKSGYY
ncbi:hypothetical protein BB559_003876 [Furculomyces boomerangus]|uniref:Uncharacterized protein n=1 Tax=Furculomyces boomerangus TaxID=61424 RepID=A0A2T9YIB3_9FUNG|nr:hypothetical protein BB559_003876 [Furculomyces boomerangus]